MPKNKKYDFKAIETKWRAFWEEKELYLFKYDSQKPTFTVDTPPPYVSADHLHAGHIMSYAQAEFIVRYKRMQGFNVFYPMGFDDNGLPTERFVEKKYDVDKSKISRSEFIDLCLKETKTGSKTYENLWKNLGISVDWKKTYSTIGKTATKVSQWSLIDLYKKGYLYRDESPILWCTFCQTALAQADLETKEEKTQLNYIDFGKISGQKLIIATTRPELLPACVALYTNPNDERYSKLIGKSVKVPLFDYEVEIKPSEKVDTEYGTGLMMVCTWGDQEDLEKWREDKLDSRSLFTESGLVNDLGKEYEGLRIFEARKKIIDSLKEKNLLIKQEELDHTISIHERCSTPTEFILSKQWFIKIADNKDKWLELGNRLNWYPEDKKKIYEDWVNSLKWDWCVSRQRFYGVPMPIWYCGDCDEVIFASEEQLPVIPTEQKPSIEKCSKCGSSNLVPETDVMDTWATSSCTPFLIKELVDTKEDKGLLFPVSLRPNAFEIIRTWDFYSLVKSYYHFGVIPFKNVMISGHGLDENGKKFSKRLGNYVPSDQLLAMYTADSIRYWATGAKLGQNLRFSEMEVRNGERTAIKLLNVMRFIQMYEKDVSLQKGVAHYEYADIWILSQLNKVIKKVTEAFDRYSYATARDEINEFFWTKFADQYIEFIKYRLRGNTVDSKFAALSTLKKVLLSIIKMYAPIMPFITEEIFSQLYKDNEESISIHVSEWVKKFEYKTDLDISDFNNAIDAINEVKKYKAENNLSLGAELEEYDFEAQFDKEKYGEFVKAVMRINKI